MTDHARTQASDIARRAAGDIELSAGPSASTLDGSFSGTVDKAWRTWDQIPPEARIILDRHGCSPAEAFVTGASPSRVRRRDTSYSEQASAWAVDRHRLILVEGARSLEALDDKRFRPSSPWRLQVTIHPFVGEVRKRSGSVPVDTVSPSSDDDGSDVDGPEIIDVLPAPVRQQMLTTVPTPEISEDFLFQGTLKGVPVDHEAGLLRATSQLMIAVHADRTIRVGRRTSPRDAEIQLAGTAWRVQTLTAQLGSPHSVELTGYTDRTLGAGAERPGLPGRGDNPRELE